MPRHDTPVLLHPAWTLLPVPGSRTCSLLCVVTWTQLPHIEHPPSCTHALQVWGPMRELRALVQAVQQHTCLYHCAHTSAPSALQACSFLVSQMRAIPICPVLLEVQAEGVPCAPQVWDLMSQMKSLIQANEQEARAILVGNPSLTRALFQAQIVLGMVKDSLGGGGVAGQPHHMAEPRQGEGPDAMLGLHAVLDVCEVVLRAG